MNESQNYLQDLAAIRSMMERSSKFLSLSGWAGVLAGIYALVGAYVAHFVLGFNPDQLIYDDIASGAVAFRLPAVIALAMGILVLAVGTAVFYAVRKARKRGEKAWTPGSRALLFDMLVPLVAGGLLVLALIFWKLIGLIAPATQIFYGFALCNAGKYSYREVTYLGLIQIGLGLLGAFFVSDGLLYWGIGFGVMHIIYGLRLHLKYER